MLADGDRKTFNRLVDHHLQIFNASEFDYLVTGCATCTAVIKRIWPVMAELKSISGKEAIIGIAEKTYDISEFLVKIMGTYPLQSPLDPNVSKTKVTYHDPCHLRKSLKIFKEPRILIQASSKYQFEEMPEPDSCCGMGGSFNLKYYGTSTDIGLKKVQNIRASGAETVATGCPACMIQLKDMLAKANTGVSVRHVIEIYSDGLAAKPEPE
jgi:glycolate oxidase iron-sulfur subunit